MRFSYNFALCFNRLWRLIKFLFKIKRSRQKRGHKPITWQIKKDEIAGMTMCWTISKEELNMRLANGEERHELRKKYMEMKSFTLEEFVASATPDEIAQLPPEYQALFSQG